MVGDRPDTDIAGAKRLGIKMALVRTGRFGVKERIEEAGFVPDFDVENLNGFLKVRV